MAKRVMILVAEDDEMQRVIILETLKFEGYDVAAFKDGADALEALSKIRPDIVLSDLQMPNMDGIRLLYEIRRDSEMAWLPFILISGMPADYFSDVAFSLGASYCLTKPWRAKELVEKIRLSIHG